MNASGVPKQASQVWYKHLQVLASIVQRVATDFALKCSEEYRVIELEQASQGYQNKSITNMSLNHLNIK